MSDIFNRNLTYAGSFKPESTTISFAGATASAIVRNINVNYAQALSRIWDLGSGNVFYIAGQTQGTFGLGTVAGVSGSLTWGDVCSPTTLTLTANQGLCNIAAGYQSGGVWTLHKAVLSQVGITAQSEDMIINVGMGGTFLYLEQSSSYVTP